MKIMCKTRPLIIILLFLILISPQQKAFANTLKFAQISDIHYSLTREDNSYKLLSKTKPLLEDAVSQINKKRFLDFVIITGDGIDKPSISEFDSLCDDLNRLKRPWYYVIGNHDTDPSSELTKSELIKELNDKSRHVKYKSSYYTFKPKRGFRVIVLDCALNDKAGSSGYITHEQLFWLDDILSKSKRDTVLIFTHFPVLPPFDSKGHEIINSDELNNILSKYDMPKAIFSGHYHMTRVKKTSSTLHVSTPALATYPNAFRIIRIDRGRKKILFDIELVETNLKEIQKQSKITELGGNLYRGREKDRNTVEILTIRNKK